MSETRISAKDIHAGIGITSLAIGARALYKCVDNIDSGKEISIAKTAAGFLTAVWLGSYSYSQIRIANDPDVYSLDRIGPYCPKPNDPLNRIAAEKPASAAPTAEVIDITPEHQSNQLAA